MQALLLCLAWNAMHGTVLVRLLEGDLLSPVTLSENSNSKCRFLQSYIGAMSFYTLEYGHSAWQYVILIFIFTLRKHG